MRFAVKKSVCRDFRQDSDVLVLRSGLGSDCSSSWSLLTCYFFYSNHPAMSHIIALVHVIELKIFILATVFNYPLHRHSESILSKQ